MTKVPIYCIELCSRSRDDSEIHVSSGLSNLEENNVYSTLFSMVYVVGVFSEKMVLDMRTHIFWQSILFLPRYLE